MALIALVVAIGLAIAGVGEVFAGNGWWAAAFFIAACAIGPGGWTIWKND